MDLAALRERLASVGVERVDVQAAVRRHLAAGGRDELDAVLHSLLMEGAIDRSHFAALSSDATVIVTGGPATLSSDAPTTRIAPDSVPDGEATVRGAETAGPAPGRRPTSLDHRYVVLGMAGKGGMGTVHVARDVDLLRKVALKQLVPEAARDASARARFNREVQVMAQLDHPNIVPVYSLEVAADGGPAYAMKLVEGRTFAALIEETLAFAKEGRPPDEAHSLPVRLEHFLKVCDAMSYAHDRGVIHRDLKPANLMLGPHNEVYVMDWGICRVGGEPVTAEETASPSPVYSPESTETQVGTIVGTPMFMSPEQARADRDLDARSDQCALGLILYKLVTLRSPYDGRTGLEILTHVVKGERRPVEPDKGAEPVARELVAIVEKATNPEVDRRYPGVRAFADDVRRFLRGEAVEARPDSSWQRLMRRLTRHRQVVAVSVLALVAVTALAVVGLVVRHERALEREAFRTSRLQALAGDVARAGDVLQTRMLEVVGELDALSIVAVHALASGGDERGPVPGLDPAAPADDAVGVFTAAPGSDPVVVRRLARRLQGAASQERALFERALHLLGGEKATTSSGLVDLRIGLAAGLVYQYPRPAGAPAPADPRQALWYQEGADKDAPHWGEPYMDGGVVRLPFGAPIRDGKGALLGVISLVLAPQGVLEQVLTDGPVPGARMALLLDPGARVIAVHPKAGARERPLEPFGEPALDAALKQHDVGTLQTAAFGSPEVLAFDRIHPFEWTLVAVVPEDVLFAPGDRAAAR